MSIDADREGRETNPLAHQTTADLRAEAHFEPDPPDYGPRCWTGNCRLHRHIPCPQNPWPNLTEARSA
jgi:hypothetical protein